MKSAPTTGTSGSTANASGGGWCSQKNPEKNQRQTLELELMDRQSTVHQLLLTSHAYKIASRVHVSARTVCEESGKEETRKLGYVSFTENRESNFHARELKTIHLVAENCVGLKLEFDEAYENEKNEHKQIGIAKIQIIGTTLEQKMVNATNASNRFAVAAKTPEVKIVNSNARSTIPSFATTRSNATTNTTFTSPPMFENMPCDAKTARRIQETQAMKQKAVEVEDYDEAKRLRDVMSRLRKFGAAVAALEAKKMNAVRLEDYDTAKMLKAEIEKMDFDAFERGGNQNNINTTNNDNNNNNNNNNSAANSPILGMRVKNDENGNEIVVNASDKSFDFEAKEKSVPAHLPLAENTNTRPDDASAIGLSNDEIPARASGRAKSPPTSPSLPGNNGGGSSFTPASKFTSLGSEINENESSAPQTIEEEETLQLSSSEERDLEPMLALFSADVVAKLIKSERWRTRDAALTEMNTVFLSASVVVEDANQLFVSVCRALAQKCLCDKITSAFIRACETLRNLCTFCCEKRNFDAKSSGSTNVSAVLSIEIVPFLLERLAEAHARARDAAKETLAHVASTVEKQHESFIIVEKIIETQKKAEGASRGNKKGLSGSSSSSTSIVSSASSKPVAPRAMVKRLETLGLICSRFDANPSMSHGSHAMHGASTKALTFCCGNLENNAGEVRKAAVESLALIGKFTGRDKVREKLPKTLKSSIRAAVERAIDENVAAEDNGDNNNDNDNDELIELKKKPTTASMTTNKSSSGRIVAVEKEAAKVFEAPEKKSVSETAAMFSRPREESERREDEGDDDEEDEDEDSEDDSDDEYPTIEELQRELSALSVTKGTRHPDYARVLVDIAAAKSDQEDYLGAVPLYEQALRIQETALGDDHPSAVQTLTDLAICRLDLGEVHKGKPLLERALVLQKQQLGDAHADVVAIREVLMSL